MGHATFTYVWQENRGQESGLSNVANVIHSCDSYLLRCLIRRCNYNVEQTEAALNACFMRLVECDLHGLTPHPIAEAPEAIQKYSERFHATNMADVVIIPYLTEDTAIYLTEDHLRRLANIMEEMLDHPPFPVTSIHDEFCAHANHLNVLRQQYVNILAELADSTILDDILSTLHGCQGSYQKQSSDLSQYIREAEYAIG